MSLFWVVVRQLAEIEAMVRDSSLSLFRLHILFRFPLWFRFQDMDIGLIELHLGHGNVDWRTETVTFCEAFIRILCVSFFE